MNSNKEDPNSFTKLSYRRFSFFLLQMTKGHRNLFKHRIICNDPGKSASHIYTRAVNEPIHSTARSIPAWLNSSSTLYKFACYC
jgi:hypothetical protein